MSLSQKFIVRIRKEQVVYKGHHTNFK